MHPQELHDVVGGAVRPLRRVEYDRLVALGAFADERVELLYGHLVTMSPQGTAHAHAVRKLNQLLTIALAGRALVQVQAPLAASDESEPEPDVAVVPEGDYLDDHPATAHLIVEVADSSRDKDLRAKAALYARMGAPEYWVVDLVADAIVVHRSPGGDAYADVATVGRGGALTLLRFPDVTLRAAELLPPR